MWYDDDLIKVALLGNGKWSIRETIGNTERQGFDRQQIQEVYELYIAGKQWIQDAYNNSIITQADMDRGYFADSFNNAYVRINVFWDIVVFAKQHNMAKHSFPF
jgi:hypothetical protein